MNAMPLGWRWLQVVLPCCRGGAQAMWLLGAGTNAGMQYADSGEINPVNSVAAGWINVMT